LVVTLSYAPDNLTERNAHFTIALGAPPLYYCPKPLLLVEFIARLATCYLKEVTVFQMSALYLSREAGS